MGDMQCCAYNGLTRCLNAAVNNYHCLDHYETARKLYVNYKNICDKAYNLDLYKKFADYDDNIKYLLKCYDLFNQAYSARMKHRKYAFVPECYDYGHDYQFIFIQEKINECENLLKNIETQKQKDKLIKQNLYEALENQEIDIKEDDNKTEIIVNNQINIRKKIQDDVDELINKYIEENKELYNERKEFHDVIYQYLAEFCENNQYQVKNADLAIYFMWRVVFRMFVMDYFDDEYVPAKCSCSTCDSQVPFKVIFGRPEKKEKYKQVVKKFDINLYLNRMCHHCVEYFCELLINYSKKIDPVLFDMFKLYDKNPDTFLISEFVLIWSPEKNRLIFKESYIKPIKHSSIRDKLRYKYETKKQLETTKNEYYDIDSILDFA